VHLFVDYLCQNRAMDRHQDDAKLQTTACLVLIILAANAANRVTLVPNGVNVRIIEGGTLHGAWTD
jgi:hypothetical protein